MVEEREGADDTPTPSSPLDKAGEFVKYLTALATGALIFSAELLKKDYVVPITARNLILFSWTCLALSALFGLAALARIPMMMTEGTDDLEEGFLKWPLRGQQVFLPLGIVALGIALVLALWHPSPSAAEEHKPTVCCKNDKTEQKFTILSSAPHILGKAPGHQHTFLLDRETGRVWDLACDSQNKVRFRSVEVENLTSAK
jgi:hypothetical protein